MPPTEAAASSLPDVLLSLLLTGVLLAHAVTAVRQRRHRWWRRVLSLVVPRARMALAALTVAAVAALASLPGWPLPILAQTTPAGNEVSIADSGFQPASLSLNPGDAVHWTNTSAQPQTVTADDGLFDSGPIPPGGGFSLAIASAGGHAYGSTTNPALRGTLTVSGSVVNALAGPPADLANDHIPDLDFPPVPSGNVSDHPRLGSTMSRTRILVGFTSSATVAQANAALQSANVTILGGKPGLGMLLVGAPDTSDFSGLDAAVDALRAAAGVDIAARSPVLNVDRVPRPAEGVIDVSAEWQWNLSTIAATNAPFGDGGNWGLEASRFPQAWNLAEATRRRAAQVDTGILDGGFEFGHGDLGALSPASDLCTRIAHRCVASNNTLDHGNHVAGIIGATYDNQAVAGRSFGISGANPVARMHGVPLGFRDATVTLPHCLLFPSLCSQVVKALFDTMVEVWDLILSGKESGQLGSWRVVNQSMGIRISGMPASEVESNGKAARRIAERAARDGLIIVKSAGNDSSAASPLQAQRAGGFTWAAANWVSSDPNPIIVVGAIGKDDPDSVFPTGWLAPHLARADFSNAGGDVSAPGVRIWSTASTQGS
ncbi:MAG TPA: S8 family serine peptidase, partial [Chloroflexota bacterium]